MKNFYFLFLLISSLSFSQSRDFSEIWVNNKDFFVGKINESDFQIKIENSEENQKNNKEFMISGFSLVDGSNQSNFKGKIIITDFKNHDKRSIAVGNYQFFEEGSGKHVGKFEGKLEVIFTEVNKKIEAIESVKFMGNWINNEGSLSFNTILEKNKK